MSFNVEREPAPVLKPHLARLVWRLTWSCLLLVGCGAPDVELARKFQAAQQGFNRATTPEDYLRTASLYQEILDAQIVSGALLYNQGNAFMRAGQRGRAIACYRQAKRYLPRDPYLEANLRYALGADATSQRNRSLLDYLLFWQDWISYPGKFWLTATSAMICFALGMLALYLRPRQVFQRLAWATLGITLVFMFSAAYDWHRFDRIQHGVIIRDEVVARKGNAESYEPAFTQPLSEGTEFRVVEQRNEWILIRLNGAEEGWVKQDAAATF